VETEKDRFSETGIKVYHLIHPLRHLVAGIAVFFVLDGKVRIEAGSAVHHTKERDVLLLDRCDLVRITPESAGPGKECWLLVLKIAPSILSFTFGDTIPVFKCNSILADNPDCSILRSILAEIACYDASGSPKENTPLFYSRIFRLLHELKQNFSFPDTSSRVNDKSKAKRGELITSYIVKNYRYPLTLENLAERFSLTPQYLSRYFKQQFGVNFHTYLNRLRLENALKDLVLSDATVTAVAYDNGFPNLSSFLKEFKEVWGKNPTEYRKTARSKEGEIEENAQADETDIDPNLIREKLGLYLDSGNTIALQKKLAVQADVQKGRPFPQPWREVINLGFARDFSKAFFLEQISLIQKESPFRYARFQGLFGKSMMITQGNQQKYSFVQIDRIIDFLYGLRLVPFIEMGFKPEKVRRKYIEVVFANEDEIQRLPISDYEKLIGEFMKHILNRFGTGEINHWRFELWAPAGEFLEYSKADLDLYIEEFVKIRRVIKNNAPDALVGGPGFNLAFPDDFDVMTKILHALQEQNSLPDFFSFYAFSFSDIASGNENTKGKNLLLWEKGETAKRIAWAKEFIQSVAPQMKRFFVTEWNLDFSCRNRLHDSLIKAPFILQDYIDIIDTADFLAYWTASDITAEYSDSAAILFGGSGLISRHGICKPAFFAYYFLSRLGGVLLKKGNGYIITEKSENDYAAIVFNYKYISNQARLCNDYQDLSRDLSDFLEDNEKLTISLSLINTKAGRYKIRQHILNIQHGSVYDSWKNLSSIEELGSTETSWLEKTCVPELKIEFIEGNGGITIECELEPNEVRLLEISRIFE
jgi:beta-xylosidase/AraC-like DNA-binding protein